MLSLHACGANKPGAAKRQAWAAVVQARPTHHTHELHPPSAPTHTDTCALLAATPPCRW